MAADGERLQACAVCGQRVPASTLQLEEGGAICGMCDADRRLAAADQGAVRGAWGSVVSVVGSGAVVVAGIAYTLAAYPPVVRTGNTWMELRAIPVLLVLVLIGVSVGGFGVARGIDGGRTPSGRLPWALLIVLGLALIVVSVALPVLAFRG